MSFAIPSSTRYVLLMICAAGLLAAGAARGQEAPSSGDETLLGDVRSSGGYGAPTVAVTSVNGAVAVVAGGQGGWILNRRFVLGGAGCGLVTLPDAAIDGRAAELQMGYGGLLLEYIGAPSELVHYGVSTVVGGGSAQLVNEDYDPRTGGSLDRTGLFVTEAGARLELNVTTYVRVGAGGGYRLVAGSDLRTVSDADLSGPYGRLSLRFGRF